MVAAQSFSISRRTLDVEDYIDIGRRHAGWIVGPVFLGIVVSICVAFLLPNEYTSKATMQITPAQVSDSVVQSTISNSLVDRIQQMEQSIMSVRELSAIINDPRLLLYKKELNTEPLEDVIEKMKGAIQINFVTLPGAMSRRATAFDIKFTYNDRFKAQQTVQALISKFDEYNQNTQKSDQDAIKGTVGDLLQKAKADLAEANDKLTAFKEGNAGKLPEQAQLNIARESGYTAKIQSDTDQIFHDREALARLATARDQIKGNSEFYDQEQENLLTMASSPGTPGAQQNQELALLDKYIENAEFNLQQQRKQYNDKYPAVRNAQSQLDGYKTKRAELEKKIQAKAQADAAQAATDAAKPKEAARTLAGIKQAEHHKDIENQLKQIEANEKLINDDITRLQTEQAAYKKDSDDVNQMLKDSTGVEANYEELRHAKDLAEATYLDWQRKQQLADANGQLIQRKVGEILDVLDVPNIPGAPTNPNRPKIIGVGFALSIILGLGMAGLQEAKDTSLKNLKDVRAYTNLPVLCSIPLLENTMLVKRKRRLTYLAWAAAVILCAAAVAGSLVYYYQVTFKS
jgi:succinoglycan biosynthesis transport protein ExoP